MQASSGINVAAGAVRLGGGTAVGTGDGHGACADAASGAKMTRSEAATAARADISSHLTENDPRREERTICSMAVSPDFM